MENFISRTCKNWQMLILERNPWKFVFIWISNRLKLPFFMNFLNAHAPVIDYAQLFSHRTPEVVVPLLLETKRRQICVNNSEGRHAEGGNWIERRRKYFIWSCEERKKADYGSGAGLMNELTRHFCRLSSLIEDSKAISFYNFCDRWGSNVAG